MFGPRLRDDARNLVLIFGSAGVAVIATAALISPASRSSHDTRIRVERVERSASRVIEAPTVVTPGAERLYGRVTTRGDQVYEGFIRWDRNEGSWSDLLDADKLDERGRVVSQTGVRFGHIARIEPTRGGGRVTMRTGRMFELSGRSTDLGKGLRDLVVTDPTHGEAHLDWGDLVAIEFQSAPADARSTEQRLYGTLTTVSGAEFTGHVAWDVDEIHASDVLDGEIDGRDAEVAFGAIASLRRVGSRGVEVTLHDGETFRMTGSNDVDSDNRGITVADAGLGQVRVAWRAFDSIRFHRPEVQMVRDDFDGGPRLAGTITTESGQSFTGPVTWDRDEAWGWEILNGDAEGAEFFVEFAEVARIVKTPRGAAVTLRDGRTFELDGSQDVGRGNRGIVVEDEDGSHTIDWRKFRDFRAGG